MAESPQKRRFSFWTLLKFFLVTLVSEEKTEAAQTSTEPVAEEEPHDALSQVKLPRNLPSIIEIKKKIPSHCFERKLSTSMYYVIKDVAIVVVLYVVGELMWNYLPLVPFLALTPLFWFFQGTMFMAFFVLGHDAGHDAFSNFDLVNDTIGTILHTFLMMPFYSWKLSHRNHHKNTGNIDKDEVYFPVRKSQFNGAAAPPFFALGIGWYSYLIRGYHPRPVPHFNPLHPLFSNHVFGCIVSLVALAVWGTCLYSYAATYCFWKLFFHYIVPDFIFAMYVVILTFLQHTEEGVPWYADHLWTNVRGKLCAVDRHNGFLHEILHNLTTHQVHHLFPKIPHYHLEEATRHFRKEFPDLVNFREERILPAFYRMFKKYAEQSIIGDDIEVHLYK